ncbi:hypothetical protein BDV98DRAFT_191018 [Pterulicium gracile]|uniref:DUF6534 domain-containing protein n=1 Tax=Pterulicium gracile TaxID=1884261 RepID=A0A5C3QA85_9AGAR|nr:hypothetical protein BDV98DRAFT_191018 [Pterula gracilis]
MSSAGVEPDPTAAPGPAWIGHDMVEIFAPFYWGCVASFVLAGITVLQAWNYFPGRDKWIVRSMAWMMITFDVVSSILSAHGMYLYLIPHFGSLVPLGELNRYLAAECYLAVCIAFISHMYFGWQIWTVLKHKDGMNKYLFAGSIFGLGGLAFVSGIVCATFMIIDNGHVLTGRSFRFELAVGISKAAASLADVIATVALCVYLANSRTGFRGTDSMVKRLMGYIIQRGLLVTVVQILFMILFFMSKTRLEWLALHVNMTKVYANTFFAMLNSRESAKHGPQTSSMSRSSGTAPTGPYFDSKRSEVEFVDMEDEVDHHSRREFQPRSISSKLPVTSRPIHGAS